MQSPKQLLRKVSPGIYHLLASIRFFMKCRSVFGPCQALIHREVFQNGPITVLGGPFKGLAYYNKTIWGTITSKWLGCYEEEIQPVIEEIIAGGYPEVVDVGAAEGYYAVGLAFRMPQSKVISYDTDPIARLRQRQLAELNGISNLEIRKYCSAAELGGFSPGRTVVICDIEGFEAELLNPASCPALAGFDILVEIHRTADITLEAMAADIKGRFLATHAITEFAATPRNREAMRQKVPALIKLSDADVDFALSEGRYPGQVWFWMQANRHAPL